MDIKKVFITANNDSLDSFYNINWFITNKSRTSTAVDKWMVKILIILVLLWLFPENV